ncbi:hypothetical protein FACS189449_06180 [Alphaproteobacteria bacterium]|nr:hypothetical protein FACS189449_06180 [Alphaproteobacteria bacterium]
MMYPSGEKYDGDWANSVMEGNGEYTYADGRAYKGQFKAGKKNGIGLMTWPTGNAYEGEWHDDKKHGKGRLEWYDKSEFRGTWSGGKFWAGHGILKYKDGRIFNGEWRNGKIYESPKSGGAINKFRENAKKVVRIISDSPQAVRVMVAADDGYLKTLDDIFKHPPSHDDLGSSDQYVDKKDDLTSSFEYIDKEEAVSNEILGNIDSYHLIKKTEYGSLQDRMALLLKICRECQERIQTQPGDQKMLYKILSTAAAKCNYIAILIKNLAVFQKKGDYSTYKDSQKENCPAYCSPWTQFIEKYMKHRMGGLKAKGMFRLEYYLEALDPYKAPVVGITRAFPFRSPVAGMLRDFYLWDSERTKDISGRKKHSTIPPFPSFASWIKKKYCHADEMLINFSTWFCECNENENKRKKDQTIPPTAPFLLWLENKPTREKIRTAEFSEFFLEDFIQRPCEMKEGLYDFAYMLDGCLRITPENSDCKHIGLTEGKPVACAGELRISSSKRIKEVNNRSGHYRQLARKSFYGHDEQSFQVAYATGRLHFEDFMKELIKADPNLENEFVISRDKTFEEVIMYIRPDPVLPIKFLASDFFNVAPDLTDVATIVEGKGLLHFAMTESKCFYAIPWKQGNNSLSNLEGARVVCSGVIYMENGEIKGLHNEEQSTLPELGKAHEELKKANVIKDGIVPTVMPNYSHTPWETGDFILRESICS